VIRLKKVPQLAFFFHFYLNGISEKIRPSDLHKNKKLTKEAEKQMFK
jgi:hypothetical protein